MGKKEIWIFLSHSYEDYDRVRCVRNMLEDYGMRPIMFFLKCLNEEKEIDNLIKREIDCRTRFILCDSPNARKSLWVQKEVEYIKNKGKDIEVINLNDSDNTIRKKILSYRRKNNLYISYPRTQTDLARYVANRLRKYDFNVFFDVDYLFYGSSFADVIEGKLRQVTENGKLIALLDSHKSDWILKELEYIIDRDPNKEMIIPVYLTKSAKELYAERLKGYLEIDFSTMPKITALHIVNALLIRFFNYGDILTYANNFRYGIGCKKSEEEADILEDLYLTEIENKSVDFKGPGMDLHLADLYSRGYGVKKNVEKAKEYLAMAHDCWGVDISAQLHMIEKKECNLLGMARRKLHL